MKKIVILMLVLVLAAGVAFAKGGQEAETGPAEAVTLRFTDWQGGNDGILAAYKEIIDIYQTENPNYKVEYQQYTVTTYNEFLKPALAGGEAPDLYGVYPGPDAFEVVQSGNLVDLKPKIDVDGSCLQFQRGQHRRWYLPECSGCLDRVYLVPQGHAEGHRLGASGLYRIL